MRRSRERVTAAGDVRTGGADRDVALAEAHPRKGFDLELLHRRQLVLSKGPDLVLRPNYVLHHLLWHGRNGLFDFISR